MQTLTLRYKFGNTTLREDVVKGKGVTGPSNGDPKTTIQLYASRPPGSTGGGQYAMSIPAVVESEDAIRAPVARTRPERRHSHAASG